jgi:hypothetical protein
MLPDPSYPKKLEEFAQGVSVASLEAMNQIRISHDGLNNFALMIEWKFLGLFKLGKDLVFVLIASIAAILVGSIVTFVEISNANQY